MSLRLSRWRLGHARDVAGLHLIVVDVLGKGRFERQGLGPLRLREVVGTARTFRIGRTRHFLCVYLLIAFELCSLLKHFLIVLPLLIGLSRLLGLLGLVADVGVWLLLLAVLEVILFP